MIQWPAEFIGQIRPLVKMIEPDASKRPEAITRQIGAQYSYDDMKAELGQNLRPAAPNS